MLEANDAATMLDGNSCKIHLPESKELLRRSRKSRNTQMLIEFNDLCYSVHRNRKGAEKTILRNVTGHFEPEKVSIILGPSGAGKTSLLKIISGKRLTGVKGAITINGAKPDRETFRKQMCYVPQQFDLLPFLTTGETLYIAARLKLDVNQKEQAIRLIVNDIAKNLNLSDCLDTLANKLSGGERKRLSIGVEMITKPSVLLLDEPTSGLDSAASNQLITLLHDMASENCTVICAIHQPSSQMISLVDGIMVLDRGRCMYCGPKSEIINTYSTAGFTCPSFYNIAEFVLEVVTEQRGGDLENLYKICRNEHDKFRSRSKCINKNEWIESQEKCETDDLHTSIRSAITKKSTWQQQKILFSRSLICMKRDNILTKLRFAMHIINAFLFGIVFYDYGDDAEKVFGNIVCIFFFIVFLYFGNAMPSVQMFPTEANVFIQEYLNNWYSLKSYYSVKILMDIPLQILCVSSFLFIAYYMTGQPMEYIRILQMWSIGLLIAILGQTVGIVVGAIFNVKIGFFLVPALSLPLLLFAGFFLKLKEIAIYLKPLSTLSFFRYTFEGMAQALYLDRPNLSCSEIFCWLHSPSKILSMMDVPSVPFYAILIILGSWILCLHITAYALLRWRIHYARK